MQHPGRINPGDRYHHLVADKHVGYDKRQAAVWEFKCDCGNLTTIRAIDAKNGNTKSCGCFKLVARKTHGMKKSSEYGIWIGIKERCFNKNDLAYHNYGGRGITMSDEWRHGFVAFYRDMGPRPSKDYSIERIDVNGNYCKENCIWATDDVQARNTRKTVKLWYKGREMVQVDIIKEMGINPATFSTWLKRGLNPDEISVYHNNGKWWYRNTIISLIFKAAEFNGDLNKIIQHDDFVIVSVTDIGNGDVVYKLVAKGKPKIYTHLLQQQ